MAPWQLGKPRCGASLVPSRRLEEPKHQPVAAPGSSAVLCPLGTGLAPVLPSRTAFHCRSLSTDFSDVPLTGQLCSPQGKGGRGCGLSPGGGGLEAEPCDEEPDGKLPALRGPWWGRVWAPCPWSVSILVSVAGSRCPLT